MAAVAANKIGNGSAWQGYYMFAGGRNPGDGLQESQATGYPNDLPRFDYDFHAPIGATGRLAGSFAALRKQHAFLAAFGDRLALMPSSLPAALPAGVDDSDHPPLGPPQRRLRRLCLHHLAPAACSAGHLPRTRSSR